MNASTTSLSFILFCLTNSLISTVAHAQETSSDTSDNEKESNEKTTGDEAPTSQIDSEQLSNEPTESTKDDQGVDASSSDNSPSNMPQNEESGQGIGDENTEINEVDEQTEGELTEESTPSQIIIDPEKAESLDKTLTKEQIKWLQPTRGKLPQNPYQHVDFTAYTLEWGELQAGLNRSTIGILPRTQIGTQVPLWALGIQNANVKVNALRLGPIDLAVTGDYLNLAPTADQSLNIRYYGVGGYGSFRILDNWSIHAGGQYAELNLSGLPNLGALSGPIKTFAGLTDEDIQNVTNAIEEAVKYERSEQILSAKIATDVRLNRRDSFILQGNMMRSETTDSGLSVDADVVQLSLESDQISSPLFQYLLVPQESSVNYSASIAYQASFKRAYLRLGMGYSTIPYAWLLQSIDLTWRWGGQTKRRANELEKIWELNKKLNKEGADAK